MGNVEYQTLIEKHQRLTIRLSELDEWIEELNSGVIVDFKLKLRQFAREIGDMKRVDRFQLGNAIVDQQGFLDRAFADRTQTQSDLAQIKNEMNMENPLIQKYGMRVFQYMENFYPGFGLLSDIVTIPFYPMHGQWRYTYMEAQHVFANPLEVPAMSSKYYEVDLDCFKWRNHGIDLLAGYIGEANALCEYDMNRRDDG